MFGRKKSSAPRPSAALAAAAAYIAEVALRSVQTEDGGVRVEDYLTVIAAAAGEAVLVSAGLFDIEHNELAPGSAVFGDRINTILTGDSISLADMSADTVLGLYRAELVPVPIAPDALPAPRRLYEHVASTVNQRAVGVRGHDRRGGQPTTGDGVAGRVRHARDRRSCRRDSRRGPIPALGSMRLGPVRGRAPGAVGDRHAAGDDVDPGSRVRDGEDRTDVG